jgi:citrate synthase
MNLSEMFSDLCKHPDEEMLTKLFAAHRRAALVNDNMSSLTAASAYVGSGDMGKAIIAALATLGNLHGPVIQARNVLTAWTSNDIREAVTYGMHVPGWGNSFFKDKVDPAWADLYDLCVKRESFQRVLRITDLLKSLGKNVPPNAAILTAYCCEEMEWLRGAEVVLFLSARVSAWAVRALVLANQNPKLAT